MKERRSSPVSVDYISGADIFFRKSVLDKIGLFDENIFMYGEESDICFRIKKAGFDVIAAGHRKSDNGFLPITVSDMCP